MHNFVIELGMIPNMVYLITMFCEKSSVIAQANEPKSHQKSNIFSGNITFLKNLLELER